jgi:hypothetical protein
MPKKKIEVYTLQRLLKEAHALLVKYKQIKKDHRLKVDVELTQLKDNTPVSYIYIWYEPINGRYITRGLFATARTPQLCLADFEKMIHDRVAGRHSYVNIPDAPTMGTEVSNG